MSKIINFNDVQADKILFERNSFMSYGYGIITQLVTKDRELSIQAKGLYGYLVSCAGNDKQTYPTQDKMCYDLNIGNVKTLRKYLKELEERGYIKIYKTKLDQLKYKNVYAISTDTVTQKIWQDDFARDNKTTCKQKKSPALPQTEDDKKSVNISNNNIIPQKKEILLKNLSNPENRLLELKIELGELDKSHPTYEDNKNILLMEIEKIKSRINRI